MQHQKAALQHQGASKRVMEKLVWTDETKVTKMMGGKKKIGEREKLWMDCEVYRIMI